MELAFSKFYQGHDFSTPLQIMSLGQGLGQCKKKKEKGHMLEVWYNQDHLLVALYCVWHGS